MSALGTGSFVTVVASSYEDERDGAEKQERPLRKSTAGDEISPQSQIVPSTSASSIMSTPGSVDQTRPETGFGRLGLGPLESCFTWSFLLSGAFRSGDRILRHQRVEFDVGTCELLRVCDLVDSYRISQCGHRGQKKKQRTRESERATARHFAVGLLN